MNTWQVLGTVAVVALALGFALVVPTTTLAGTSTSTASTGANGLRLGLSVNDSTVSPGQFFGITVSEYNTLTMDNNVSAASNRVVNGGTQSCPSQVYPFGISVFQGHYGSGNVSEGAPVQIFPITACPMFIRLITGYDFLPQSVNASVLPGSTNATAAMQTLVTVGIKYPATGFGGGGQLLSPGPYTIVASDEWGSLAFLYVTVA